MANTSHKFALDNTLRYLYNTFRNTEITMAIEFKHGGRSWRADTVEEAIELRKKLEDEDLLTEVATGGHAEWYFSHTWTVDTVTDLLKSAGALQKGFLLLLHKGNAMSSHDIIHALGLKSEEALAGVLSGLSKQLKQMELKPWNLYSVEVSWDGKEKTRRFRLVVEFYHEAQQLGWPDGWQDYQEIKKKLKTI